MNNLRTEYDLLGEIQVPADVLYGAQTQRAVENFPLNGEPTIGDFREFIQALINIKQAAAQTNCEIGVLSKEQADAIVFACRKIIDDQLYDQFVPHYLHGGGGTSANMNVNEVIANIGEQFLGGRLGEYRYLHPNDHINLHQSTNDVIPTACHLAVISKWHTLRPRFEALAKTLNLKTSEFENQKRIARTCLQDAVDITFGDFLSGYATLIERCEQRLNKAVLELSSVSLGGTIIGRPTDVPAEYFQQILVNLNKIVPDADIRRADNLFDAFQNLDDLVAVSAQLDLCARSLIKIAKDIRLLVSGPEAGLQELELPAVQPGSSIMPGKINPVIPEFLIQVCFRVIGNHQMCSMAVDHGELDLNVWESPVVFGILESMNLLDSALSAFVDKCLNGLTVPAAMNDRKAGSIIAHLAELMKIHGYSTISNICKDGGGDFDRIRELLAERGLSTDTRQE
ncbi:MAG: aspartate ammonia-lyase [Cellvibrionaceae bacterium]|jgi:aspartate ammonia-lyase